MTPNEVEKTYLGPSRWAAAGRELACLTHLAGRLPVPVVVESDASIPRVTMRAVSGRHGQDLIDEGQGAVVLRLVGAELRALQAISPAIVPGLEGEGGVLVHGDFGPQNMLFNLGAEVVTAILDWEWAHVGDAVEDLAWAEWTVRMHHPRAVDALDELFVGAGTRPPSQLRHNAMVRRCRAILLSCEAAEQQGAVALWSERLAETERWSVE